MEMSKRFTKEDQNPKDVVVVFKYIESAQMGYDFKYRNKSGVYACHLQSEMDLKPTLEGLKIACDQNARWNQYHPWKAKILGLIVSRPKIRQTMQTAGVKCGFGPDTAWKTFHVHSHRALLQRVLKTTIEE